MEVAPISNLEAKIDEVSLLEDDRSSIGSIDKNETLELISILDEQSASSKPEISMDEIDMIIRNRTIKVSTIVPVVKQTSGQRIRMILLGQSNFDSLVSEASGVKYGSFERPELTFFIINIASLSSPIRPLDDKIVPSIKRSAEDETEDDDGTLILFDKARCLFILSPSSADELFLKLKEERSKNILLIQEDMEKRNKKVTGSSSVNEDVSNAVYIPHTTRTESIGTPPSPATLRVLPNIPLLTIHQGFCMTGNKIYPELNSSMQRLFQRFLHVFLYPQLDDAEFMAKLLKRHAAKDDDGSKSSKHKKKKDKKVVKKKK